MSVTKEAFAKYVDAGHELAERVKKNIQKDRIISDETVLALNEFIIASNAVKDLTDKLNDDSDDDFTNENDDTLN